MAFQADLLYLLKLGLSTTILEILAQRKFISAECQAYSNFTKPFSSLHLKKFPVRLTNHGSNPPIPPTLFSNSLHSRQLLLLPLNF